MDFDSLGWKERLQHVEAINAGTPSFFIMCRAEDPNASPREIASFDRKIVFIGGKVTEYDNDTWVALDDRLTVREFKNKIS
jgi:hypothetical protein